MEPVPGSTLSSSRVTFSWTPGSGVLEVSLWVGTRGAGAYDVYANSLGTASSVTLLGVPTNGGTIYVRLWSRFDDGWQYDDYTCTALTATGSRARLTSIVPEGAAPPASVTFTWTPGTNVSHVILYVGTSGVGSSDIAAREGSQSATVPGVPTDGRTVYVRLWSFLDGWWEYDDYAYQSSTDASAAAELTSPGGGSTLASPTATFRWTAGRGLSGRIALSVGTTGPGSSDVYYGGQTEFLQVVSGIPIDGRTVFVRVWSYVWGAWQYCDYRLKTGSDIGQLTTPAPEAALPTSSATFEWTAGRGVSQFALYVGTGGAGSYDVYSGSEGTNLSRTVSGLPAAGARVFVRLWSNLPGGWQYADYTYVVGIAQLTSPAPGTWLAGANYSWPPVTFGWTTGPGVIETTLYVGLAGPGSYDLYAQSQGTGQSATVGVRYDRPRTYVRLWSHTAIGWQYIDYSYRTVYLAEIYDPPPQAALTSSTVTFRCWHWDGDLSQLVLSVGTTGAGSTDLYNGPLDAGLLKTVWGLPTDGRTLYVRLRSNYPGGSQFRDYTYQAPTGVAPSDLTSPGVGSTLISSSVTFGWTGGSGVSQTALYVGTAGPGSSEVYAAYEDRTLSTVVPNVPTDGRSVFVRLWSFLPGGWLFRDYTFPTGPATLTSPTAGSALTSSTVTFVWTPTVPPAQTVLYVGTAGVGSSDLFAKVHPLDTWNPPAETVTGLPANGVTLYVRLWTYMSGWQYRDYTYTAMQ